MVWLAAAQVVAETAPVAGDQGQAGIDQAQLEVLAQKHRLGRRDQGRIGEQDCAHRRDRGKHDHAEPSIGDKHQKTERS